LVVVLALLDDGLVVAGAAEEGLTTFTSEGPKVEPGGGFLADSA